MRNRGFPIRLPLSRTHFARLIATVAALNLIMLLGTYAAEALSADGGWAIRHMLRQFNLGWENNISVWYASMLLLAVALTALGCFIIDVRRGGTRRDRQLNYGWLIVALVFAGLSFDELGSIHERLEYFITVEISPLLSGWVELLMIPIGVVGLFFVAFAWVRVRQSPAAFALMILGAILLISIPVQEQIEAMFRQAGALSESYTRPPFQVVLEEGTEIFGIFSFFAALLVYAKTRASQHVTNATADHPPEFQFDLNTPAGIGVVVLLWLGIMAVLFGLPQLVGLQDGRGLPLNWFASTSSVFVALASLNIWIYSRARSSAISRESPFLILFAVSLFLSIDHGAGHLFTARTPEEFLAGTPALLILGWFAGIVLSIVFAAVAARMDSLWGRAFVVVSAVLIIVGLFMSTPWNPLLASAGSTILLLTLVGRPMAAIRDVPASGTLRPQFAGR